MKATGSKGPGKEPKPTGKSKVVAAALLKKPLYVQVLWGCQTYNATPEEAAKVMVADLLKHLSKGGAVKVNVEEEGGQEYTLEVSAK